MNLLIVLPAFNEEATIKKVVESLPRKINGIGRIQCLVVNDGSSDQTASLAASAGAHVVTHAVNRGVGAAFHSAVKYALESGAHIMVGFDADGQFSPEDIPALIQPIIEKQADLVIGDRFANGRPEHMSGIKYRGNQMVARLVSYLCRVDFRDVSCGFRAYNRNALLHLNIFGEFTYTHEVILNLIFQGLQVTSKPISVRYFAERRSRVADSIWKYAIRTAKIITRVLLDYAPMRIFGTMGGIFIIIGAGFTLFLLMHYLLSGSFTPYKATGFIGLGFAIMGLLVLLIALVADMLNRMRVNQDRMLYELKKANYGE